ncbi:MAG TPA: (Fe-S)-binding protein [Lacipirellulaceae bacterium]|jgi:L-lactate dehydrogenase complex protein LldE|nr:(Fe-S)-binding protein [Lacipirellulaceae bacterium]
MRIGLFIPCYIDQFYPHVGLATVEVLERCGAEVDFPEAQTCCGQPLANAGLHADARPLAERFLNIFQPYDYVVSPSGSCVAMVRHHYHEVLGHSDQLQSVARKTFELCEFLTDVLHVERLPGRFPHRVGLHQSCHAVRELRMAAGSERVGAAFNKPRQLLETLEGVEITELRRPDECCGFGGLFSVTEEAVSCMMGNDRIADHERGGTEVLTSTDMSCLMHLEGLLRRQKKLIRVMHIAEVFAAAIESRGE